jgi:hypothetical protein
MKPDSTFTDTLIWGTPAHLVGYIKPVRQSDTMDFSPNNDWQLLEPKTDIPRSIVKPVTVQPEKPLDQTARAVTVGSCAAIWVLLPFIVWLKISGR